MAEICPTFNIYIHEAGVKEDIFTNWSWGDASVGTGLAEQA